MRKWYFFPLGIILLFSISSCLMFSHQNRVGSLPVNYLKNKYESPASAYFKLQDGTEIHYQDEGDHNKPALFLIHGAWSSLQVWEDWVKLLGKDFRFVRFDLPAHGLTGPGKTNYRRPEHSFKIIKGLSKHLGIQKFILVGNSLGGQIAWRYALTHQGQVKALVLIDASGAPTKLSKELERSLFLLKIPFLWKFMAKVPPKKVVFGGADFTYSNKSVITEKHVERTWELMRYPGSSSAFARAFAQWPAHDKQAGKLKTLEIPTLILWGKEDQLILVEAAKWFHETLPRNTLKVYEKVGHAPMEEVPEETTEDFKAFLRRNNLF